jgi:hypothetical protein
VIFYIYFDKIFELLILHLKYLHLYEKNKDKVNVTQLWSNGCCKVPLTMGVWKEKVSLHVHSMYNFLNYKSKIFRCLITDIKVHLEVKLFV